MVKDRRDEQHLQSSVMLKGEHQQPQQTSQSAQERQNLSQLSFFPMELCLATSP